MRTFIFIGLAIFGMLLFNADSSYAQNYNYSIPAFAISGDAQQYYLVIANPSIEGTQQYYFIPTTTTEDELKQYQCRPTVPTKDGLFQYLCKYVPKKHHDSRSRVTITPKASRY